MREEKTYVDFFYFFEFLDAGGKDFFWLFEFFAGHVVV
jgi:hypothetical protein